MTTDGNFFSGAYLDRRSEERSAAGWLAQARADSSTLYIPMQGTKAHQRCVPVELVAAAPRW
ncbi:MAG: hypothetical protein ABI859_10465 [Pseudomonadota bacterium]